MRRNSGAPDSPRAVCFSRLSAGTVARTASCTNLRQKLPTPDGAGVEERRNRDAEGFYACEARQTTARHSERACDAAGAGQCRQSWQETGCPNCVSDAENEKPNATRDTPEACRVVAVSPRFEPVAPDRSCRQSTSPGERA